MTNEEEFFLTGSRAFGGADQFSDWDFFISMETFKNLARTLSRLGFVVSWARNPKTIPSIHFPVVPRTPPCDSGEYNSQDIEMVLHCSTDGGGDEIHIQVVKDVGLKLKAQGILKGQFGFRMARIPKDLRVPLWNMAFSLARFS
jgi:hypothetical protein